MLVGINYPWIDYGWDFGGPPPAWVADDNLPAWREKKRTQSIVGEFATAGGRDWPDLKFLYKDQTVSNRLSCIEDKGYPACLMWSARAVDPATRWTEEEQRQVLAYTSSILLKRPGSKT